MAGKRIFLSHINKDKAFVKSIERHLSALGNVSYLDAYDIHPEEDWLQSLDENLRSCDVFLLFVGPNGIGPWHTEEIHVALQRRVADPDFILLPVLLPEAQPEDLLELHVFLHSKNALQWNLQHETVCLQILEAIIQNSDPNHIRQLLKQKAELPETLVDNFYTAIHHFFQGIEISFSETGCEVKAGKGKNSLNIPPRNTAVDVNNIESILSWESRLTPLIGRNQEQEFILKWAESGVPEMKDAEGIAIGSSARDIKILSITGLGGVGKTRLAFTVCETLRGRQWCTGQAKGKQGLAGQWFTSAAGTLIVIDYPEHQAERVRWFLEAIYISEIPGKIRILLLSRELQFVEQLLGRAAAAHQNYPLQDFFRSPGEANEIFTWQLFQNVSKRLDELAARPQKSTIQQSDVEQWFLTHNIEPTPLYIIALALYAYYEHSHPFHDLALKDVFVALVNREMRRIEGEAMRVMKETQSTRATQGWLLLKALAAVPFYLDEEAVDKLSEQSKQLNLRIPLPNSRQLEKSSLWQESQTMGESGRLTALKPDLFAASFLQQCLTRLGKRHFAQYLLLALEADPYLAANLSSYGRLRYDAVWRLFQARTTEEQNQAWPQQGLIELIKQNQQKFDLYLAVLSRDHLGSTLHEIALELDQTNSISLEALYKKFPEIHGPDLASSLNNLSIRLAGSGQREAALKAIERAVAIREQLGQGMLRPMDRTWQ